MAKDSRKRLANLMQCRKLEAWQRNSRAWPSFKVASCYSPVAGSKTKPHIIVGRESIPRPLLPKKHESRPGKYGLIYDTSSMFHHLLHNLIAVPGRKMMIKAGRAWTKAPQLTRQSPPLSLVASHVIRVGIETSQDHRCRSSFVNRRWRKRCLETCRVYPLWISSCRRERIS